MKLTWKRHGDKYKAGVYTKTATVERGPLKTGWVYLVESGGRTIGGGPAKNMQEAKSRAEEVVFGQAEKLSE